MSRILVLYWYPEGQTMRPAVARHLHALDGHGDLIVYHNANGPAPAWLRKLRYDGVVLHTTFLCERWSERFDVHRARYEWVANLRCPKVAIPQDEYDHSAVLDRWLEELGVETILSIFGPDVRATLYPSMSQRARFVEVLTGYVDENLARRCAIRAQPHAQRRVDVVYRAAHLPYWFGSHGQLKHRLGEAVLESAARHGTSIDISTREEDTIFGDAWGDFLMAGKTVLGCESGSSALDPSGGLQARIRALTAHQTLTFEEVSRLMPNGWDSWQFFAISPRHLEAVVTKTCQVLVEGTYNGILEPGRHYVPLRRDLANLDDVLEQIQDVDLTQRLANHAYEDIYLSGAYSYERFANVVRQALNASAAQPGLTSRLGFRAGSRVGSAVSTVGRSSRRCVAGVGRRMPPSIRASLAGILRSARTGA